MKRSIADKSNQSNRILKKVITTAAAVLFWIGLWWFASILIGKEVVLPSPYKVFIRLAQNITTSRFWLITAISLLRVASGFVFALAIGFILSLSAFFCSPIRTLLNPFISILRSVPIASFILFFYMWLSTSNIPIVSAFIVVLPVVWENVLMGLENTDKGLIEVCKVYKINGITRLKILYLPSLKPYFNATIMSSMGMAWKAAVAAEVLTTPKNSIGKELYGAKVYLDSVDLFAWTAVIIILSFMIESLIRRRLRKR